MGKKIALLIGVSEYEPGLNALPAAVNDVDAMQRVLANPEMGGFTDNNIAVLKNPQRQDIEEAIYNLFANRSKDDLLLFYFSGHGIKDEIGRLYLSTRATRKDNGKLVKPSAVAANVLHENINDSKSQRQVIILDCCFSGAIAQGMTVKDDGTVDIQQQLGGKGRAILTSSTSTQYAFEQEGSQLSIYTRYIVEGIEKGAADKDSDGWISVDELHEYASAKVQEASPAMTPKFYPVEEGHKILLAKSPKDDPKLIYRKEVEQRIDRGNFSKPARRLLNSLRIQLKLASEIATAIEDEVKLEIKLSQFEFEVITVNAQGQPNKRSQARAEYFTEDLGNGVTLEMVAIPGGTFIMGSPENEAERLNSESPQHKVTIQPFFMGKYPITQKQWAAVAALPKVKIDLNSDPSHFKGADLPIECISWNEATEFCSRLSQSTQKQNPHKTYRLPREAEWEYACSAGTTTEFHFGETITTKLVNYDGNYTYGNSSQSECRAKTTEVAFFPPNAFGLYDMHGNVWEWCQDDWQGSYKSAAAYGNAWLGYNDNQKQKYNDNQNRKMLRGGSWLDTPWDCRSACRCWYERDHRDCCFGFRVVCVLPRT